MSESDLSAWSEYTNDYLHEIPHNNDVNGIIRKDIEEKFKISVTNATYCFPRSKETS